MRQLFQNLICNALKFRGERPPLIQIRSEVKGKTCNITVRDNGIGFEEKYLDWIFRSFQRLHSQDEYQGTGIGLPICRKIVEHHNGVIAARSQPGNGTAFIIELPVHQRNPNAVADRGLAGDLAA